MISNLINHNNLQNFIVTDIPVWHRAYSFGSDAPDIEAVARAIKEATGISLMAEQKDEPTHGFISCARIPGGVNGTCGWCLDEGQDNTQHTCIIISLYREHIGEEAEIEAIIEKLLQDHHKNISFPTPPTT